MRGSVSRRGARRRQAFRLMAIGFAGDVIAVAGMAGAIAATTGALLVVAIVLGNVALIGSTMMAYRGRTQLDDYEH